MKGGFIGKRKPHRKLVRVGLITLPASNGEIGDKMERAVAAVWKQLGPLEIQRVQIGADPDKLARLLRRWADREGFQLIFTVGKSGHRPEDFAPDVTRKLLHRTLPGIEERMYLSSPRRPENLLFRGRAGIRKGSLVVNLPGRMTRVRQILRFLAPVLVHALEKIAGNEAECAKQL